MGAVHLNELEHASLVVDDGAARALVARTTGMIHVLNDAYMDEEAPVPADAGGDEDGEYVVVPPASTLGIGDQLVLRFAAAQMAGDQATVQELFQKGDTDGFTRLLEERGATEAWQRFRTEQTRTALQRWCDGHGLRLVDGM